MSRRGRSRARCASMSCIATCCAPSSIAAISTSACSSRCAAMKELIAREVERRELEDNIKLGPGGIREIEFIVQAFQLIRGGSDPRLQTRSLLRALSLLAGQKLLPAAAVDGAGRGVSVPAPRREPAAGVERRADARAAGGRGGTGAAGRDRWAPRTGRSSRPSCRHTGIASATHFRTLVFGPAQTGAGNGAARELERILEPELDDDASRATAARHRDRRRRAGAREPRAAARERISAAARRDRPTPAHDAAAEAAATDRRPRFGVNRAQSACCTCWSASAAGPCISRCSTRTRSRSRGWSISARSPVSWPSRSRPFRCCSTSCSTRG